MTKIFVITSVFLRKPELFFLMLSFKQKILCVFLVGIISDQDLCTGKAENSRNAKCLMHQQSENPDKERHIIAAIQYGEIIVSWPLLLFSR